MLTKLSRFISAVTAVIVFAEAIRPSNFNPSINSASNPNAEFSIRQAPHFINSDHCIQIEHHHPSIVCNPNLIHVAITLDETYLRGTVAAVHSILAHSDCPQNIFFHFLLSDPNFENLLHSVFPLTNFKTYQFDSTRVANLISSSIRQALEQPLNYARNYLADIIDPCVSKIIYLDSDLIVIDDISNLWNTSLDSKTIGAPEYCHANFTKYFTEKFWSDQRFKTTFKARNPCYFNTGVMVIDLDRWRADRSTQKIERWMEVQKKERIYELGSLPPYLLVFAGRIAKIEHRWNQHGLGGDNVKGSCRGLHSGPVSLMHWSGSGKPWTRLDEKKSCPLDKVWKPFDLYRPLDS